MLCQRWGQAPSTILSENAGIVSGILLSLSDGASAPSADPALMELIDRASSESLRTSRE